MLTLNVLHGAGELRKQGVSRPAELYEFSAEKFETLRQRGLLFPF
jgi:AraR C-terminal winged HTH domain